MNTTTKTAARDHAGEDLSTTTGRQAPVRPSGLQLAGLGLVVAALTVGGTAAWHGRTGQAPGPVAPAPVEAANPATRDDPAQDRAQDRPPDADPVPTELARVSGDIDGDGRTDVVQLMSEATPGVPDQITISWGTEGIERHALTGGGEGDLLPLRDLDGDGDLEVVVSAGGGEASWYDVFTFTGTDVVKVGTDGATGAGVPSLSGFQNEGWSTTYLADGFVEYRFADPGSMRAPAPIELRDWVLDGTALAASSQVTQGCWVQVGEGFGPSRDAC